MEMAPTGLQDRQVVADTTVPETSLATRSHPHQHSGRLWYRTADQFPLDNPNAGRWIAWPHRAEVVTDQHEAEAAIHLVVVMAQEEATAGQGVLRRVALGEVDTLVKGVEGTVLAAEVVLEWAA